MNNIKEYLSFHSSALALREKRNTILASNIANAATPNFKARDIDFTSEMKRANGIGELNVTNSNHIKSYSGRKEIVLCTEILLTRHLMEIQLSCQWSKWSFLKIL